MKGLKKNKSKVLPEGEELGGASITFIGSGNVAQQLAPALKRCGYNIPEVCSRNPVTGKQLAKKINASFISDISNIEDTGGVVIIAVKDDAISEVVKKLPALRNSLV